MKFGKREVNLILGVLSLVLLVVFFFFIYSPKQDTYQNKVEELNVIQRYIINAKETINKIPELEKNADIYSQKRNTLMQSIPNQVNHLDAIVTLEKTAKETSVDLYSFSESRTKEYNTEKNENPTNICVSPNIKGFTQDNIKYFIEPAHNFYANVKSEICFTTTVEATNAGYLGVPSVFTPKVDTQTTTTETTTPTDTTTINNNNTLSYDLTIKGEYRSILTFLYKIQNLNYITSIENFKLVYSEKTDAQKGFPLMASFKVVFIDQNSNLSNMNGDQNILDSNDNSTSVVSPSAVPTVAPNVNTPENNNNNCTVKGITVNNDKVYHVQGSPSYDSVQAEELFCSEQDAQNAGYRAVKR